MTTLYRNFLKEFNARVKAIIENRLDVATGGLYRGNVEKNQYESLGVYFGNVRAADPRFYEDDPITIWGTIRSKTYSDAVIINFSCYRTKGNTKIPADKVIPDIHFPIFTLEEADTECTFYPKRDEDEGTAQPGRKSQHEGRLVRQSEDRRSRRLHHVRAFGRTLLETF